MVPSCIKKQENKHTLFKPITGYLLDALIRTSSRKVGIRTDLSIHENPGNCSEQPYNNNSISVICLCSLTQSNTLVLRKYI